MSKSETIKTNKVKVIRISPELLKYFFTSGVINVEVDGIPDGCQYRGFAHDWNNNCINLFIEHESFPVTPEGMPSPVQEIKFKNLTKKPELTLV